MDINILREIATVASFVTFVGIWGWAWSRSRRAGFEEAGNLPFQAQRQASRRGAALDTSCLDTWAQGVVKR